MQQKRACARRQFEFTYLLTQFIHSPVDGGNADQLLLIVVHQRIHGHDQSFGAGVIYVRRAPEKIGITWLIARPVGRNRQSVPGLVKVIVTLAAQIPGGHNILAVMVGVRAKVAGIRINGVRLKPDAATQCLIE